MTYDNGAGYMFAYTMDGIAVAVLNPKQIGTSHLDNVVNGRKSTREMQRRCRRQGRCHDPLLLAEARSDRAGAENLLRRRNSRLEYVRRAPAPMSMTSTPS